MASKKQSNPKPACPVCGALQLVDGLLHMLDEEAFIPFMKDLLDLLQQHKPSSGRTVLPFEAETH